jgi:hypothetical protein
MYIVPGKVMQLMKERRPSSCTSFICICIILFPWIFHCYWKKYLSWLCISLYLPFYQNLNIIVYKCWLEKVSQ